LETSGVVERAVKRKGFTLVELMAVAAIVAIMAGVAVPCMRRHIQRRQLGGRVTLVDRAGDGVDVIVTPVIGRIWMEWVPQLPLSS
jgi:prepilin-type N-terminal cleavage/methylation domain-containing protein